MSPETNLQSLLRNLNPVLNDGQYVFCDYSDLSVFGEDELLMSFQEEEGKSLIVRKEAADRLGLHYSFVAAWITLKVYSSPDAVGLTAVFASALSRRAISCNVVAALRHDHIFVGVEDAHAALEILQSLSGSSEA